MPNAPKPAKEKRSEEPERKNDQAEHEGSPHSPDAYDDTNPARQVKTP
jgi:hypothetical protein